MSSFMTIPRPDTAARTAARRRRELLPPHALGALGPVVDRLAGIYGTSRGGDAGLEPTAVSLVVFAGDHGIAEAGVSAYPPGTTALRIREIAEGGGAVGRLATSAGVTVRAVDVAVRDDLSGTAVDTTRRVRSASGRIDTDNALTAREIEPALRVGIDLADAEIDAGATLLIGAVCGVAVSTPTAALVSAVTGMEPVDATTRGSGIDDAAWIVKCAAVRDARFRARAAQGDARELLAIAGGPDLAALTGFIAQAATRRTPVLVDDVPSLICAILANRMAPGAGKYVIVADTSGERTEARLHQLLAQRPLADRRLALGSGCGALLTVPQLRAAAGLVDDAMDLAAALQRGDHAIDDWDPALL